MIPPQKKLSALSIQRSAEPFLGFSVTFRQFQQPLRLELLIGYQPKDAG
jgi:hypothetical protein